MGLFGSKAPKPSGSAPFFTRIPIAVVQESHVTLSDFSLVRSYAIKAPQLEGIESEAVAFESEKLGAFLKNLAAPNAFIQVTVAVHTDLDHLFNLHRKIVGDNYILKPFAEERIAMLAKCIDYHVFLTITVPCTASVTVDGKKKKYIDDDDFRRRDREADNAEKLLYDVLIPLGYEITPISGFGFMHFLASVINPGEKVASMEIDDMGGKLLPLNKRLFNSDFLVKEFYITNGKYKFASLVMDIQPSTIPPMAGSRIMRDINFPVIFNYTILNEDQQRVLDSLDAQRKMAIIFMGKKSAAAKNNEEKVRAIDAFGDARVKENWKLMRTFTSFLVWDEDEKNLHDKLTHIRSVCARVMDGAGVFSEWLRKENAMVASLPGCAIKSYDMLYTASPDAAKLIPLRMHFAGDREKPVLLQKNRWGSITAINPFSAQQNRWAGVIVGPSGSGKSHFMNEFIFSMTALDPFIAVFDIATAPSFDSTIDVLGGCNITVTFDSDAYRVNPFDLRLGFDKPVGSKILSLDAIMSQMLLDVGEIALSKVKQSVLQTAIDRMYERFMHENPKKFREVRVSDEIKEVLFENCPTRYEYYLEYRDYFIERFLATKDKKYYNLAEMAQNQGTPTLQDFIQTITTDEALRMSKENAPIIEEIRAKLSLYATGLQARLFNGVTNFIVNNDIYNFHLGLVRERKEVLRLLVLLYRDFAFRKAIFLPSEIPPFINVSDVEWIAQIQKRPKFFLYDEFHNLGDDHIILDVLDKDARQQRTLGMATYLATQAITDIAKNGKNFLSASANKYLTRHLDPSNPHMQTVYDCQKELGLNNDELELLKSLTLYPGKYGEILALCEGLGKGVIRSEPSPLKRWLFTTHKDERYTRDTLRNYLIDKRLPRRKATMVAAQALAEAYPDGAIGKEVDLGYVKKIIDSQGYY